MNNRDITQAFLSHYNLTQIQGGPMTEGEIAPLIPFFIADAAYDFYRHSIRPVKWQYNANRHQKGISKAWKTYTDLLTDALDIDQQEYIGDKMTEMEDMLHKDMYLTEIAYQNCFLGAATVEQEKIIGGLLMCGNLAKLAYDCFFELYTHHPQLQMQGDNLRAMQYHSRELGKCFLKQCRIPDEIVPEKHAENLEKASNVLLRKLAKWIDDERKTS